ncbi:MAG: putative ABC transporter permease [Firmicutes bacterium]|nr:putative ABC transporter permease [Bacillota bacterium]
MNKLLILAFLFFIGCMVGWGIEVLYRRYKRSNVTKKWVNPGFLTGPWLPLYGCGLCLLYLMAGLEGTVLMQDVTVGSKILLFAGMALVMTLLEYIAGLIFIKGMNIKLWDYSNEPFNLQGIICLRFSIYWAILGAVYYFLIHPRILEALNWFAQNLAFSFVVGMFYGVFLVDLVYSLNIVAKVRQFAVENQLQVRYEELKLQIQMDTEAREARFHFLFSFQSETPLREHLKRYMDLHEAFGLSPRDLAAEIHETMEERRDEIAEKAETIKDAVLSELDEKLKKTDVRVK